MRLLDFIEGYTELAWIKHYITCLHNVSLQDRFRAFFFFFTF